MKEMKKTLRLKFYDCLYLNIGNLSIKLLFLKRDLFFSPFNLN